VPLLREVRMKHFAKRPPANTLLVVASLARPDFLIEIEAVAVLSNVVRHTE
jgi:enamine deaminase RidA (YjgF/YER057c/UK114 family)